MQAIAHDRILELHAEVRQAQSAPHLLRVRRPHCSIPHSRHPPHPSSFPSRRGNKPAKATRLLNSTTLTPRVSDEQNGDQTIRSGPSAGPTSWPATVLQLLILFLAALIATHAMWGPALLAGHSAWFDLTRMVEFDAALRHGELLPVWSPDFYHGYGSPLFQFYAPFCYYLTEIPVLFGCDLPTALKVTQLVALFASGLAMYRLAVTHFSGWVACFGGVLYMIAPYRLVDIYVRHALAEHCAFIWLPLIVWGTERFLSRASRAGLLTGAVATAGLILTHNVMALIGLPFCVFTGWILSTPRPSIPHIFTRLLAALVPAALGIGLAAFFWWPAMAGRPLTHAEQSLTGGYFDFHQHFVSAARFISLDWGFGESGRDKQDSMSLQIGLLHLLMGLVAVALLFRWRRENADGRGQSRLRWCLAGFLIMLGAAFLCSAWSQILWDHLPLIKYAQFPWRFLGVLVFGAALCGTAVADRLSTLIRDARAPQLVCLLGATIVLAAYFPFYLHARFIAGNALTHTLGPVTSEKLDALRTWNLLIPVGQAIKPANIRSASERATSSDDFLPRGVLEKPAQTPAESLVSPGNRIGPITQARLNDYRAEVDLSANGTVQLQQFWFPGWQAEIDGGPAHTMPTGPQAVVSCAVPAGHHTIEFHYDALPQRRTGRLMSLAALVLTVGAILFTKESAENPEPSGETTPETALET